MNRFVWEPPEKLQVGGPPLRPRTARDLLDDLGVSQGSMQDQREAVNGWLVEHSDEVDQLMRMSLEHSGFRSRPLEVDSWSGARRSAVPGPGTVILGDYFPHEMPLSAVTDALLAIAVSRSQPATCTFAVQWPGGTIFRTNEPRDVHVDVA